MCSILDTFLRAVICVYYFYSLFIYFQTSELLGICYYCHNYDVEFHRWRVMFYFWASLWKLLYIDFKLYFVHWLKYFLRKWMYALFFLLLFFMVVVILVTILCKYYLQQFLGNFYLIVLVFNFILLVFHFSVLVLWFCFYVGKQCSLNFSLVWKLLSVLYMCFNTLSVAIQKQSFAYLLKIRV